MNKSAIQRFAIWARTELIAQVSQRAYQYGITKDGYGEANAVTVGGRALSTDEQRQRKELVQQIQQKDYTQVMEEVAYTWFNRFIALRFMEVNNYLPSHIRVFSDSTGAFKPEILNDVLHLELPGLNTDKVAEYIENNQTDDLYRYLLLTQCNALNEALPRMFERMGGYTELLLPNNILKQDGILGRMVTDIPEEDWTDQVQIIGWLYQYYNSELKDDTFALLKKNVKITKERIPSATQLFTPDWIVRYMVENSLGRLWIEHLKAARDTGMVIVPISEDVSVREEDGTIYVDTKHPEGAADNFTAIYKKNWKYYLEEAEQEAEVQAQLEEIRKTYADLSPQDIKVIDPCMGSGHILVYAFDVLMDIYTQSGWNERDAAQSILKNNLYGLDIDDRAAQLAYFAVMMKARQYDRRIFSRGIQPHVYAIVESNGIYRAHLDYFGAGMSELEKNTARMQMESLLDTLRDAKEYGSILHVERCEWELLRRFVMDIDVDGQITLDSIGVEDTAEELMRLIDVGQALAKKYDVVVTNPPYMGSSGMGTKLAEFVKKNYPDSKSDLFAVFIERCGQMAKKNGYQAMITQHAWMFLSSFEKLRAKLLAADIVNMAHLGARAFEEIGGEVVQTTSFVIRKSHVADYKGEYCRLIEPTTQQGKEDMFLAGENRYAADQSNFSKIPGSPVAYWWRLQIYKLFEGTLLSDYALPKVGLQTGENDKYLRYWSEVDIYKIGFNNINAQIAAESGAKWFPCNKGGEFRRWYGNNYLVVDWEFDGKRIKLQKGSYIRNPQFYFKKGMTWSTISSGNLSVRYSPEGFLFETKGSVCFPKNDENFSYLLGLLNTNVAQFLLTALSPTLDYHEGPLGKVPAIIDKEVRSATVNEKVNDCVCIAKSDWDSYETSWDFKRHPLV